MYRFNCFFITVGIVFFLFKLYLPFIYAITTVFYYRYLEQCFPVWNEKKLLFEHSVNCGLPVPLLVSLYLCPKNL